LKAKMANINLLPSDLGPKASVLRLAALLKRLTVAALAIFCVFSVLTIAYVVFLNTQIKKVSAEGEVLQRSIKALEETEQKLFLVKDRLASIKSLTGVQTLEAGFGDFERILTSGDSGVSLTKISASPGEIRIWGATFTSRPLGDFLEEVLVNPDYKTVNLAMFAYNPATGYTFELGVSTK